MNEFTNEPDNNEPTIENYQAEVETIDHINSLDDAALEAELNNNAVPTEEKIETPEVIEPEKDALVTDETESEITDEPEKDALGPVTIDDEYIKNADEKDRAILESIKGETLSAKMVKKQLAAEHGISRFKSDKGQVMEQLKDLEKTHEESRAKLTDAPAQALPEEKVNEIDKLVSERMKAKHTDFPTTKEERDDLRYEDGDKYEKYRDEEKAERVHVEHYVEKVDFIQKNYGAINTNIMDGDIALIKSEMAKQGITPEKMGISFDFDENGKFKDERMDALMHKDGKYDVDFIDTKKYGVPVVKENGFATKFEKTFRGEIWTAIREKGMLDGSNGTVDPNKLKGMSNQKPGSAQPFKTLEQKVDSFDTVEELDKELANT